MELKNKKYIKNTGTLPQYYGGRDEMFRHLGLGTESTAAQAAVSNRSYPGAGWINNLASDIYAQNMTQNMIGTNNMSDILGEKMADKYKQAWYNNYKDEYENPRDYTFNKTEQEPVQKKTDYEGIVGKGADMITSWYDAFQPRYGKNELLNNATYTQSSRYGVPYQLGIVNIADANKGSNATWWNKVGKSAIAGWNFGSSFGGGEAGKLFSAKDGKLPQFSLGASAAYGLAGGIASGMVGILGASNARFKELEAQQDALNQMSRENKLRSDIAGTQGIQNMYADYNKLPIGQIARFSCGKKPKFNDGKRVRSPFGLIDAEQNAWGDGGEILRQWSPDGRVIAESRLPKHKAGTDTYPLHIDALTEIIPAKIANKMEGYKQGKLPKYYTGSNAENAGIMLTGIGAGLDQLIKSNEPVKRYSFNTPNTMLAPGLRALSSLRISPYPIMRDMSKMYAKSRYAINNSGLSGGLKDAAYMGLQNTLMSNQYNMLTQNQAQNNAYISDWAKTGISAGEQQAARDQQASIAATQLSDAAMANKYKMRQGAWYNMLNAYQQYVKNKEKMDQFKLMYGLYSDDLDIRRDELKNRRNG